MSPIRTSSLALGLLLSLFMFLLSGCGDKNPQADYNPQTGAHPASWLPGGHKTAAIDRLESCSECHGSDFTGGISKVACTQCHLGNEEQVHPLLWGQYAYALHGSYSKQNGNTTCANVNCHGANLTGVAESGPSCTSCHMGGLQLVHPTTEALWMDAANQGFHALYVGQNGTASCRNVVCHGPSLKGVFLSGPSCNACHNFPL